MTDEEYPGPRVEESGTPCLAVSSLPSLPVRILVLGAPDEAFGARLTQLAADLGAGGGVDVTSGSLSSWHAPMEDVDPGRYDVVVLRPVSVPSDSLRPDAAAGWLVERLAGLLGQASSRVWLMDAPADGAEQLEASRREDLARRVVRSGGPPAVVVPAGWADQDPAGFLEAAVERLLHDATVLASVERAQGDRQPAPLLLVPEGRRHGLDLARLLEDHRARIGERHGSMRGFEMEFEALRTGSGGHPAFDPLGERLAARAESLAQVKEACEEINRDRDPAGWTRLAENIRRVGALEAEEEADRIALRTTAARVAEQVG